jgi:superfamily I DNA and/or RNA helicase
VNAFERDLIAPLLRALSHPNMLGLDPGDGFGIVVPHRAQRAALQDVTRKLPTGDVTGGIDRLLAAVDTVERFQGGERDVIVVSATESDRQYLLTAGEFLYDPRRLTVALSRAKKKMILVAARSVFDTFVTDEDLFQNTLLWKRLLRRTCTIPLWSGERAGHHVKVWGNVRH